MTKNVHFSSTNVMYSPLLWSPSSEASTSSLPPSPSGTPPPQLPESAAPVIPRAPIIYSPWPSPHLLSTPPRKEPSPPSAIFDRAQIHFLLSFAPFTPPQVHYDLSHPLYTLNPQLTPSFLDPATYPPLASLTVLCRHLAWPISIYPSSIGGFVSVLDVLTAVVTSLRLAVRRPEYETLPAGDARQSVDDAFFARCRLVADEGERRIEESKGVKRVDFLMGKTRFLGLSGPLEGLHVWELNVS
ncbi:hypothetical protein FB451DRAFT_1060463 [Mycena latifolia]|nr:hypothetical protein FB451DRAFT_1060463 [Mycena latifolia]